MSYNTFSQAVNYCIQQKLEGKSVPWSTIANECGVHPEKLRGKVRRRFNTKKEHLPLNKFSKTHKTQKPKVSKKPYTKGKKENVLVIGDLHEPFSLDDYLDKCRDIQEKYECGTVIQIGDLIDAHAWSFHTPDPDGLSVGDELDQAVSRLSKLWHLFPTGICTIGNHDERIIRKAFDSGLSRRFLKDFSEIVEAPKDWEFTDYKIINGIYYFHGTGASGQNAAFNQAKTHRMSVVMGHIHTHSYVRFHNSMAGQIFAMQVGTGINEDEYAFQYSKHTPEKSAINCGVILDNGKLPIIIPV